MLDNDYPLGFRLALHRKDLAIALELANQLGASLPVAALAAQLETGLIGRGHGDDDMSALARAIRGLSGLDDYASRLDADARVGGCGPRSRTVGALAPVLSTAFASTPMREAGSQSRPTSSIGSPSLPS